MSVPVMIFAAGFGTRMGALTKDRPKPLIEVAGKALLDHTIDYARVAHPPRIVVNTHYKAAMIATHLADTDILISDEQPEVRDTGGGLRHALPLLQGDTVLTLNSDAIWTGPNPAQIALDHWEPADMDALLVCVPVGRARGRQGSRGDFSLDPTGRVTRHGDLVFGGVQIIKTSALGGIEEQIFSLNIVWDRLQANGRLCAVEYPGHWCDVGHPDGIQTAEAMLREAQEGV